MITIELPKALGLSVDGKMVVEIDEPCATVGDSLAAFGRRSPGALDRLVDEQGDVRMHVNIFRYGASGSLMACGHRQMTEARFLFLRQSAVDSVWGVTMSRQLLIT